MAYEMAKGCWSAAGWLKLAALVVALLALGLGAVRGEQQDMTAYWDDARGAVYATAGLHDNGLAWASYDDLVDTTGWARLTIVGSSHEANDERKARGMGYLEGLLSHNRIYDAYSNILHSSHPLSPRVVLFASTQFAWMKEQVKAYPTAPFWQHVGISLAQLEGMAAGYNDSTSPKLTLEEFYILTNAGDLEDLVNLPAGGPAISRREEEPIWDRAGKAMECSGLIKLTADGSALFAGHATFNMYSYMLRVFKHYTYNIRSFPTAAQTVSFSSRPGDLESKDDFYLLDSQLVVLETSLAVFNKSLYERLTPRSVPCWVRVNVANRLATTANEWADLFARENSGTHNNQWIVLDYKMFHKAKQAAPEVSLLPNTVWLVEQMPGIVEKADVTHTLLQRQLYVPSYNIPYFPSIFNISGYRDANYSYANDPRAKMFRAYSPQVRTLHDMSDFINSNNWQHDPLSLDNPCNAISARCDLQAKGAYAFGGIDAKVTSDEWSYEQQVRAISGPSHQNQPPFSWSPAWSSVAHRGMPDTWDFDWQIMSPYRP